MTTTATPKTIKAVLGFTKTTDDALVTFVNTVYSGMNGNTAYPTPPVDMPTFEAAIVSLTSLVAAAADGGKKAAAGRGCGLPPNSPDPRGSGGQWSRGFRRQRPRRGGEADLSP